MQQAGIVCEEIKATCEANNTSFLIKNFDSKKIKLRAFEPLFKQTVGALFTNLTVLAGIKEPLDQVTKADILRFIQTRCSDLTLEEIYKAFEMERFGDYETKSSHFQLFGSDYCSDVIKKYRKWKQMVLTQKNISAPIKNQLPEKTASQIKQELTDAIIMRFNEFKAFKPITEPCGHVYDELLNRGLVLGANSPKRINYYNQKQNEAAKQIKNELQSEILATYSNKRKDLQKALIEVQGGSSNKIIVRTKKIVLEEYFLSLIEKNIDIETILKK